jgi:hypothetical protein
MAGAPFPGDLPEKGAKIRKDAWRGVGVGKLQKKNQNKEK